LILAILFEIFVSQYFISGIENLGKHGRFALPYQSPAYVSHGGSKTLKPKSKSDPGYGKWKGFIFVFYSQKRGKRMKTKIIPVT
jgi:hypothetical protein